MKQENHPKELRTNSKGANRDVDLEILGATSKSGQYLDARNARVSSTNSEREASEKIKGELIIHQNIIPGDYVCICAESVNKYKVEFWVDDNEVEDPVIVINGVIVAKSPKIPFNKNFPIQHDKNDSCIGGEIFVTDHQPSVPPMIFNMKDMVDSLTTNPTKYFTDFNPDLYYVNLNTPLNIPVFSELVNVGGNGGLPVGSYVYDLRYVTVDGDRTDWTPPTPAIPVVENLSSAGNAFPWCKTFGAAADVTDNTNYAIKLKFRVTNSSNFDFIEIRRRAYQQGLSNILTPTGFIIAKVDIGDGEISVREFIDPVDSNVEDIVPEQDEVDKLATISRAKGIRYHDKKIVLMNVEFESKNIDDIVFKDISGDSAVPVMKNLGTAGFKDPYNHTYNKRYKGGEKYGFAAVVWSGTANSSFAKPVPGFENYQFPNRRDPLSADSKALSYTGAPRAATVAGAVDEVFEAFDLENNVRKFGLCEFKNIMKNGSKPKSLLLSYGCPDRNPPFPSIVGTNDIGYRPFRPVSQNDSNISGLDYEKNVGVDDGTDSSVTISLAPKGYAPNIYSTGLAFGGITNIPSWGKGFSYVKTEPAGRVIMQGIGAYNLTASKTKSKNKVAFFSADTGLVSQSILDDITENPRDYKVQLVSPLGFFSEIANMQSNFEQRNIDIMTYARILHDEGSINPNEHAGMGVSDGGRNYVAHNRYRNGNPASAGIFLGDGNREIDIKSFVPDNSLKNGFYELEFTSDLYYADSSVDSHFQDANVREWHEPMYIINIINVGAEVKDRNVNSYKSTGHFQKIESIVAKGTGLLNQEYELVDERWEDCIPDLTSGGTYAGFFSYIFIRDTLGLEKRWMNVTYRSLADRTTIINDITSNGFHVPEPGVQIYGIYTHNSSSDYRNHNLVFDIPPYYPSSDETIVIRYDDRRPIQVFGGDNVVSDNMFTYKDNNQTETKLDVGFPYYKYRWNPRYFLPSDSPSFGSNGTVEGFETSILQTIRQMAIMYTGETKAPVNYAYNVPLIASGQSYPLTGYVMRPGTGADGDILDGVQYYEDYGIGEKDIYNLGGYRTNQRYNIDYAYDGEFQFFSKPSFGFVENTNFCTAVIWSQSRALNVQDSPGLKTFINTNRIDISDDMGEIKKAYDAQTSSKGENLYAICEKGICLLLTKKSILSNIDGDDLSTTSFDQFISGQYWLTKTIGSDDEMWRGMGERSIGFKTEGGIVEKEALFFPNKNSVYSLVANQISDIARGSYLSRLKPYLKGLKPLFSGFLTGAINKNNNEYFLDIENGDNNKRELFVFGSEERLWEGTFDYKFDKYYMSDNKLYGVRNLETYELENGFIINGADIIYEMSTPFAPSSISLEKEFINIAIQTGLRGEMKPSKVEFYDQDNNLLCSLDMTAQGPLFLKQYDGWTQFIGRKDAAVSSSRDRVQGRVVTVKVIHDKPEDFKVVSITMQYKVIK